MTYLILTCIIDHLARICNNGLIPSDLSILIFFKNLEFDTHR